jgi:prophage antirepressor-like protein
MEVSMTDLTARSRPAVVSFAGVEFPVLLEDTTFSMRARDLGRALGYAERGKKLLDKVRTSKKFVEGRDYVKLTGNDARTVEGELSTVLDSRTVASFRGSTVILTEPGVWRVLATSERPEADEFQRWLYTDVLPALRRGEGPPSPETATTVTGAGRAALDALRELKDLGVDLDGPVALRVLDTVLEPTKRTRRKAIEGPKPEDPWLPRVAAIVEGEAGPISLREVTAKLKARGYVDHRVARCQRALGWTKQRNRYGIRWHREAA